MYSNYVGGMSVEIDIQLNWIFIAYLGFHLPPHWPLAAYVLTSFAVIRRMEFRTKVPTLASTCSLCSSWMTVDLIGQP